MISKRRRDTNQERARFEEGLPDYHDPTAGIGGAAPTYSALSLRMTLAIISLICAIAVGVFGIVIDVPWLYGSMLLLALIVIIDLVVIVRRKRRGEPG